MEALLGVSDSLGPWQSFLQTHSSLHPCECLIRSPVSPGSLTMALLPKSYQGPIAQRPWWFHSLHTSSQPKHCQEKPEGEWENQLWSALSEVAAQPPAPPPRASWSLGMEGEADIPGSVSWSSSPSSCLWGSSPGASSSQPPWPKVGKSQWVARKWGRWRPRDIEGRRVVQREKGVRVQSWSRKEVKNLRIHWSPENQEAGWK